MSDQYLPGNTSAALSSHITSGYRPIKRGERFDNLFPIPETSDKVIIRDGDVDETVDLMKKVAWKYKADTGKLAPMLKGKTLRQTCENIWNFLYNHIQYRLDKRGLEQLRRPARSWHDRSEGIDCDCFSIFVSTILINLNIPHTFRITKYDQDTWQHVYVIVPTPKSGSYHTIDCVLSRFDFEKPYNQKKDFTMSLNGIDIAVLSGVGDSNTYADVVFARDLEGIENIGDTSEAERLKAMRSYLQKTRDMITANPKMISSVDYPPAFIEMLDYALKSWDTPNRDKALEVLARNEDAWNKKNGLSQVNDTDDLSGLDDDWPNLDGLLAGNTQLGKISMKGFFKKVGEAVKKGGKLFVRFNPATIAVRSAFLLAMKLDIGGMASKLKWGYATQDQAKAKGISVDTWNKSKKALDKIEKLFADKLQGQRSKLKSAILSGKAKGIDGSSGLGVVLATSVAAASPVIVAVLKILTQSGLLHKKDVDKAMKDVEAGKITESGGDTTNPENEPVTSVPSATQDGQQNSSGKMGFLKPLLYVGAAGLGIYGLSKMASGKKKKQNLSGTAPKKARKPRKQKKAGKQTGKSHPKSVTLK